MKIAILLTDVDDSDFTRSFPDDAEKFRRLLQPLRPNWDFTTYPVKDNIFPADIAAYDGIVITGSPASVHDDRPWIAGLFDLIRHADAIALPMFGACFGHQAIATALGGKVGRNALGWGLGATTTTFTCHLPFMREQHPSVRLYCAHNEQVIELPEGAIVLGHDPIASVSAFALGDHILATQHHPEMTPDYVAGLLDYMEGDVPAETMAGARLAAADGAQGDLFAVWIADFLASGALARRNRNCPVAANQQAEAASTEIPAELQAA